MKKVKSSIICFVAAIGIAAFFTARSFCLTNIDSELFLVNVEVLAQDENKNGSEVKVTGTCENEKGQEYDCVVCIGTGSVKCP